MVQMTKKATDALKTDGGFHAIEVAGLFKNEEIRIDTFDPELEIVSSLRMPLMKEVPLNALFQKIAHENLPKGDFRHTYLYNADGRVYASKLRYECHIKNNELEQITRLSECLYKIHAIAITAIQRMLNITKDLNDMTHAIENPESDHKDAD